jgi:hypothetical protein
LGRRILSGDMEMFEFEFWFDFKEVILMESEILVETVSRNVQVFNPGFSFKEFSHFPNITNRQNAKLFLAPTSHSTTYDVQLRKLRSHKLFSTFSSLHFSTQCAKEKKKGKRKLKEICNFAEKDQRRWMYENILK